MKPFSSMRSSLATLAILTVVGVVGCGGTQSTDPAARRHVTIGIQVSPAMALVMVAKDKQFFEQQGLDVELKEFTAGKFALQAFLGGSLDFAIAGEVPVTLSTIQGSDFRVVTQVVERTINEVRVVARRDESATDPKTFFASRKRKLATSFGGGPEFYTYNFLKKFGISPASVEIISQKPEDMPAALASGSVDAIAVFDPFAFLAERQLGAQAVVFSDPDLYSELYVMTATRDRVQNDAQTIEGVLRGLALAKDFIDTNPAEAKAIVVKYTKQDASTIDGIWENFVFAPALNELLIDYQTQQAAWAKETGAVAADAMVPDFRERVAAEMLRRVSPEAVTLAPTTAGR